MPITDKQREARRQWLGASDVPAILGLCPFRTPADVQAQKLYTVEEDGAPNEAAELGNDLEPVLLDWAARELGATIRKGGPTRRPSGEFKGYPVGVNLDAIRTDCEGEAVEAKYTSKTDGWGDPGSDQVPDRVAIQCQVQMGVCNLQRVWVPVLMPAWQGMTRKLYCIDRDDDAIRSLLTICRTWWAKYVEGETKIAQTWPAMDVLKHVRREPETQTEIPIELACDWEKARRARLDAAKAEDAAKSKMIAALGDNEGARLLLPDGTPSGLALTYKETHVKERYQAATTYRKAHVFKPKGFPSLADRIAEMEQSQQLEEPAHV